MKANGSMGILTDKPFLSELHGSAWERPRKIHIDMCIHGNRISQKYTFSGESNPQKYILRRDKQYNH